jgi:DNA-binding CsgD family transcriptional regulator
VTLYDELRIATRRQFHRAAGNAIETVYRADLGPHLPELTRHFQVAGGDADVGRAIDYAVRAGRRADGLLAFEDAVQFFRVALDAMEQRSEPDEELRCRLLLLLGGAQGKAGDSRSATRTLLSAADIASALGEHELFAGAALAYEHATWDYVSERATREQVTERGVMHVSTPPAYLLERALQQLPEAQATLRAQLMAGLARALWYAGAATEARARGAQAVAMARQLGDPGSLAVYLGIMIDDLWATDHSDELIGNVTEMIAAAERARHMETVGMGYGWRLGMHLEFGNLRAAEADLAALVPIAAQVRRAGVIGAMVAGHFMLALMRGELAEAERRIAEAQRRFVHTHEGQLGVMIFSLRREQGRLNDVGPALSAFLRQQAATAAWLPGLAVIHAELGQLDEARLVFERLAADDFVSIAPDGRWHFCMGYLSEVCATLGDAARAATLYRMLGPYTGRNLVLGGGMVCCGSADRYLGLLAATMSHWADAAQHFEQALVMNQAIEAHVPLAHTRHDYAAMLLARDAPGDRERAADLLRLSLESARAIGMRVLEQRAGSLLAGLAPILEGTKPVGDGLTSREADVLRLIAIGRSNADIAMVLEISLNTVATHVRNILAKTCCANRTEAAAYAIRNGLAAVMQ